MTVGILVEKESALNHMATALGGSRGTFEGTDYVIAAASGHLYTLATPRQADLMVGPGRAARYKNWDMTGLPWDAADFTWAIVPVDGTATIRSTVTRRLSGCDELVIATDCDPTGEGDLIAMRALDAGKLLRPGVRVSRMNFVDEMPDSLRHAFRTRTPVPEPAAHPPYRKALFRDRWDLLSMQWSRMATLIANKLGVRATVRMGRLKTAMVVLVGDQQQAYETYRRTPFFQNRFRDENGIVYIDPNEPRYPRADAVDTSSVHPSAVVADGTTDHTTAPPALWDLATLAGHLATQGITAATVQQVYQELYEAQIVSYPRTSDTTITTEQFAEMLPLVDQIAAVVGVDTTLLTHRNPRPSHVADTGAHGANRPGPVIPADLDTLRADFGAEAVTIYRTVALSFLAMFAADHHYVRHTGHVADHPTFVGHVDVTCDLGWRAVFADGDDAGADERAACAEDDTTAPVGATGLGSRAEPFVHEGANKRPRHPTQAWLVRELKRRDIGTGATRNSTFADITRRDDKTLLAVHGRGRVTLTPLGRLCWQLAARTHMGDLTVTKNVQNQMDDVAAGTLDPDDALNQVADLVVDDLATMGDNAQSIDPADLADLPATTDRFTGIWQSPTGPREVSVKRVWAGHTFTDEEIAALLEGDMITITVTGDDGRSGHVTGELADKTYRGHAYVGFASVSSDRNPNYAHGTWQSPTGQREVSFKRVWAGHTFTDDEIAELLRGEQITITANKRDGGTFEARGMLAEQEFNGTQYVGFARVSGGGADDPNYAHGTWQSPTGQREVSFKRVWAGHTFTDDEIAELLRGEQITITANKRDGGTFEARGMLAEQEFNGKRYVGFDLVRDGSDQPPRTWSRHRFTDEERTTLAGGGQVLITDAVSSTNGKTFSARVLWGTDAAAKKAGCRMRTKADTPDKRRIHIVGYGD